MNKPTPLGKTYEQYEKELKEFNLSKVERVELGLVDDFSKELNTLKKFGGNYQDKIETLKDDHKKVLGTIAKFLSKAVEAEKDTKKAKKMIAEISKTFSEMQKAVKELGININTIEGVKTYTRVIDEVEYATDTYAKKAQDFKSLAKAI